MAEDGLIDQIIVLIWLQISEGFKMLRVYLGSLEDREALLTRLEGGALGECRRIADSSALINNGDVSIHTYSSRLVAIMDAPVTVLHQVPKGSISIALIDARRIVLDAGR